MTSKSKSVWKIQKHLIASETPVVSLVNSQVNSLPGSREMLSPTNTLKLKPDPKKFIINALTTSLDNIINGNFMEYLYILKKPYISRTEEVFFLKIESKKLGKPTCVQKTNFLSISRHGLQRHQRKDQ